MGRSHRKDHRPTTQSHTLPSSPTHSFNSSSSSDFEFTISLSPRKSSAALCPADELFYKGQLLPLHLSPRLSMVRTLLLSSSDTSSSSDTTSRDSTASHSSSDDLLHCDSSRPSSVADEEFKRLHTTTTTPAANDSDILSRKPPKYFSLSKFSSVFRKENKIATPSGGGTSVKRASSGAKEVLRKYLNKVKPLYERLSQKRPPPSASTVVNYSNKHIPQSFSGNLRCPRRRSYVASCPSSMMSSPRHGESWNGPTQTGLIGSGLHKPDASSMEELQSAIQGAIAHCKNSMMKTSNTITVSNDSLRGKKIM